MARTQNLQSRNKIVKLLANMLEFSDTNLPELIADAESE
jgi:hypothetical protein